jgi:hypothetical protein
MDRARVYRSIVAETDQNRLVCQHKIQYGDEEIRVIGTVPQRIAIQPGKFQKPV